MLAQNIDTDESNPTSLFVLHIFAAVADNAETAIMRSHAADVAIGLTYR